MGRAVCEAGCVITGHTPTRLEEAAAELWVEEALRALADRRPGPRHVRNLWAIVARAFAPTDR
jgi:hypothetical protein